LYGYFEQQGQFYLVQEWIQGETLGARVRQAGPLSEAEVLHLMTRLLPVLDYLHHHCPREVIHRDVKPENIILREQDQQPMLIDFGAVKQLLKTVVSSAGGITCSVVIGSGGFMPPEQAAQRVVYSSDLYSLGMTAIFALTGRRPDDIEKDRHTSEPCWQQYAPQVSGPLLAVLNKATQLNPRDRYSTADEMLQALQALTQSSPTLISTPLIAPPSRGPGAATLLDAIPQRSQQWPLRNVSGPLTVPQRSWNSAAAIAAGLVAVFAASALGASVVMMAQSGSGEDATALLKDAQAFASDGQYQAAIAQASRVPSGNKKMHAKAKESIGVWEALETADKLAGEGKKGDAIATLLTKVPADAVNAGTAWKKVTQWSAVSLENGIDKQLKPLNIPNAKRKLVNLGAKRRADVEPKTKAKPLQTVLGTSPIQTWKHNWPQGDQPTAADLKNDPKSWGDPWRESYAFASNKMTINVLYGCATNKVLQTEVLFDRSVSLDLIKTKLDQILAGQSTPSVLNQLENAYDGKAVDATFNTGEVKGIIRRTPQDRIQISARRA
ncbi:MAG: serine/threonine-protein kinase, partial [Thermosynechococcaceae cyanobacterium]